MYHHVKKLMYTVRVDAPDPKFGNMLLEQFGGANGELAAAMQYSIQGLNCDDPERKDLLMDIGTEELSHLEIVGTLARMLLAPMKFKTWSAPSCSSMPARWGLRESCRSGWDRATDLAAHQTGSSSEAGGGGGLGTVRLSSPVRLWLPSSNSNLAIAAVSFSICYVGTLAQVQ